MQVRTGQSAMAAQLRAWRTRYARACRYRLLVAVLLPVALGACVSQPGLRPVDAEPVAERELPLPPGATSVPTRPGGKVRLAEGVFRVHLSNLRCVRAPCPTGYMISNVEGQPPALRPDRTQSELALPERVRFDAAAGGAVEAGLVDRAHMGEGIVVRGRAWRIEGGRTLRIEVAELLED